MNFCRVCLRCNSDVKDINEKSHNGRNLLSVFNELLNIYIESPCFLCSMCEKGLRFTYDFRKKAIKSTQFFETEIKIEFPDEIEAQKPDSLPQQNFKKRKFHCRYCLIPFSRKCDAKFHESQHLLENKGLECNFCHKHYGRSDLIKHIKLVHFRDATRRFFCDKCSKNFSAHSTLSTHKRLVHSVQKGIFNCFHCKKEFSNKYFMRRHVQRVHGDSGFKGNCHHCGRNFSEKRNLKNHILGVHFNIKNFKCKFCEKRFSSEACRINHMRTHTSNFSFNCNECNLSFRTNSNLQRHHINRHTNIFQYKCEICSTQFKSSTGLKLHQSKHFLPKFQCNVCGKQFTRNQGLQEHIRVIHLNGISAYFDCKQEINGKDSLLTNQNMVHVLKN
uniref:CSON007429 protein n=1 Tax=Culicoides sonorensis TaxID=179676 RepID=A0A336M9L2_CULSO